MNLITIIGTVGAAFILIAFFLNETHKLDTDGLGYNLINFVGAVTLIIYAYFLKSLPFLILNVIWAGVALRDIVIYSKKNI